MLTPERSTEIQNLLGSTITMAFDECTPYPCDFKYAEKSLGLTHRWLERCIERFDNTEPIYGHKQAFFPIVQGSTYPELRKISAETIAAHGREGNAIGGLSVGEPAEEMYAMTELVTEILPKDKPRYLMGVGTPENILEGIARGIDMFDCVLPTRNARHGMLYTTEGIINIRNQKWQTDFSPIDPNGSVHTSRTHSKAYLRHLFVCNEILGMQLATLQNLGFYLWLVEEARNHILDGTFLSWKNNMVKKVSQRI